MKVPAEYKHNLCATCGHTRYYHPRKKDKKDNKGADVFPCCAETGKAFEFCKCVNFRENKHAIKKRN